MDESGETIDVIDDRIAEREVGQVEPDDDTPNYQDAEWLHMQYHGLGKTISEIAEECVVTPKTIRGWMDRHGIDRRSNSEAQRKGGPHTDPEWLREQYWGKGKTISEIAEERGVSHTMISRWMDRHGIDRRSRSEAQLSEGVDERFKDPEWLREQYWEKGKSASEIAEECGVGSTTIREWMDRHGIERRSLSEAQSKAQLKRQGRTVVFRVEHDGEIPDHEPIEVEGGNARYRGSPLGIDHVKQSFEDRPVIEVHSPWRDRQWLREQYWNEEKSTHEIAEECGVDHATISGWMDKHGIDRRSNSEAQRKEGPHTDPEWLREQYWEKGKSTHEIAEGCGVAPTTISKWMGKHGIERRSRSEAARNRHSDESVE